MWRFTAVILGFALIAGCTSGAGSPAVTPAPTTIVESHQSTIPTTSTTKPSASPVAWIAPSGVPLAVTGVDGAVVEVLSPCGDPARFTQGAPVYEVDVVVDPGHGGPVDTGAVAPTGLPEKEVNLRVSLALGRILQERGIATMLTRVGDYPIPIPTRVRYAELMGASVLVSIHHNAPLAPASGIPGVEIFVQKDSTESQRLGGLLYDEAMAALGTFDVDWARAPDAGVMTVINSDGDDAYGMVRRPSVPSALVELGYIANRAEAELYQRPEYVARTAAALADAVEAFLQSDSTGAPLVEGRVFDPRPGVGKDRCVEPDLEADLYPNVLAVEVEDTPTGYEFTVTVSSTYDHPDRYADAWRIVGDDGVVYGIRELTHPHEDEQPFVRTLGSIEIPDRVRSVMVEGRDSVYGWGGASVTVDLP